MNLLNSDQPGLQSNFWDSQGYTEKSCFKKPETENKTGASLPAVLFFFTTVFFLGTIYFFTDYSWVLLYITEGCVASALTPRTCPCSSTNTMPVVGHSPQFTHKPPGWLLSLWKIGPLHLIQSLKIVHGVMAWHGPVGMPFCVDV